MINYIWAFLIILSVIFGSFRGATFIGELSTSMLESTKSAVSLAISMLGIIGMWNGIINIASDSGLIKKLTKKMDPAISFLFPNLPKTSPVRHDIATNMISNILGLGWAATPAGLRAMKGLNELRCDIFSDKSVATNEMCTFLLINISSLQLIPINIIAYRAEYGSASPTFVVGPGIVATMASTVVAVLFCKCATSPF